MIVAECISMKDEDSELNIGWPVLFAVIPRVGDYVEGVFEEKVNGVTCVRTIRREVYHIIHGPIACGPRGGSGAAPIRIMLGRLSR